MAGLGRRTHYRKHLTDSIIYDMPEPGINEKIAKVVATRGGNQFDIILAQKLVAEDNVNDDSSKQQQQPPSEAQLAILPTKFNKLVWVKRNDYVIVETAADKEEDDPDPDSEVDAKADVATAKAATIKESVAEDTGGIRFIISHILYKDQVKHLQSKGLWPTQDPAFSTGYGGAANLEDNNDDVDNDDDNNDNETADDGIVYDTGYDDDDAFLVNTNHIAALEVADSSDSDSD